MTQAEPTKCTREKTANATARPSDCIAWRIFFVSASQPDSYLYNNLQKFSKQIGTEHIKLQGKKFLFEFDPFTPYERLIRGFVLEQMAHNEAVVALTKKGSAVRQALENDEGIVLFDLTSDTRLSQIVAEHRSGPLSLVCDSLTDLALSTDPQYAYRFAQNAVQLLSEPRITVVFLINSYAHDQKIIYRFRGLFNSQVSYGKQGIVSVKML